MPAAQGLGLADGRWGFEVAGYRGFSDSYVDRSDDRGIVLSIEYEAPLYDRFALALRAQPLFLYRDANQDDDVWGGTAGLVFRVYQVARERRGLYGQLGVSVLATTEPITHNSSELNFVSEAGIGYRFADSVHIALTLRHISNAGLDTPNSPANAVGVGIGFSF